jgi:uncharacterized OB-fold protein
MEMKETRVVTGQWELSGFDFRIEADGMKLMMSGMKDGKFTGIKCHQCGTVYLPGPFYCRKCHIKIQDPIDITDHGTVMSYTAVMADIQGKPMEEPQIALMVQFDGCDSWIMGALRDVDWKTVKIGQRVKVKWKPEAERVGSLQDMDCFEYE